MAEHTFEQDNAVAQSREPWQQPRIINVTSAREAEAGILVGPEILIKLS